MGEIITFKCPDGSEATGYRADARDPRGGIVVIQEWWGLNDQIRGLCDRFAEEDNYTALAPDLYHGRVTGDADEANHMMTGLDWVGATNVEVRGAVQHLKSIGGKVAVMGFCMGGALTIISAVKVPEVDVAVCFYGIPPKEAADPAKIRVPFQGHFATKDDWCTPAAVAALEKSLKAGGVDYELHSYDAAHAFFNEQGAAYDAAASAKAWQRTLKFLAEKM